MSQIPKRFVGIDYGMKRIGISLSDERGIFASPYKTVETEKKIEDTLTKLLLFFAEIQKKYKCEIEEIVVGLPLMMSGKKGLVADEVHVFFDLLSAGTSIPVRLWDERLTTVQAERALRETDMSRKKRSKVVDIVSAAIILQSFLDYRSIQHNRREEDPLKI